MPAVPGIRSMVEMPLPDPGKWLLHLVNKERMMSERSGPLVRILHEEEDGLATAEYGIVMLATVPLLPRNITWPQT